MNEILKQRLYDQAKRIKDPDIRKFTTTALDNAPAEFWIAPCSSTGKHHPPEDNVDGGSVIHTLKCLALVPQLAELRSLSEVNTDIAFSATTLHDIKKNGEPWGNRTDYTHGLIAYRWLAQFPLKEPEKEAIRDCVRYHMAKWVEPESEVIRATHPTKTEEVVQLVDYVCSRDDISFLPGIKLPEDVIKKYLQ